MLTAADINRIADQHRRLLKDYRDLDEARAQLDRLVRLGNKQKTVAVTFSPERGYNMAAEVPVAVLIQQSIYGCAAYERAIVKAGGSVPVDMFAMNRRLEREREGKKC
jgi:hypothetical protein